jgi:hypothetical protein
MKKKLLILMCIMIASTAFLAACKARNDKNDDITANDLVGVIGKGYNEMKNAIGEMAEDMNEMRGSSYSYKRNILGKDSEISISMDENGDKVERIIVYTDKESLDDWRDHLGQNFGVGANDLWNSDHAKVRILDGGDRGVIYIEKAA